MLGIFSYPGASNFRFNKAILESLHEAGHQITFLTTFASEVKSSPNFTFVDISDISGGRPNLVGGISPYLFARYALAETVQFLYAEEEKYCAEIIKTHIIKVRDFSTDV